MAIIDVTKHEDIPAEYVDVARYGKRGQILRNAWRTNNVVRMIKPGSKRGAWYMHPADIDAYFANFKSRKQRAAEKQVYDLKACVAMGDGDPNAVLKSLCDSIELLHCKIDKLTALMS